MMKTAKMTVVVLIVAAMTGAALAAIPALAESEKSILISDLNFPLIQLPAAFDSHRSTERLDLSEGQEYKLIDAKGPGCVRHFWITTTAPNGLNIEITCDGAEEPQVKMSMLQFFGILFGKDPYRIESAPIKVLPQWAYSSYYRGGAVIGERDRREISSHPGNHRCQLGEGIH